MDRLEELAKELDAKDILNKFRNEFIYPEDKLYFDGNSLGLLSKKTKESLKEVINNEWGQHLISSWNNSWMNLPKKVSKKVSIILNSNENEIYVGGSTSLNLYKLLLSLIKSSNSIKNISTDNLNFPSDKYICEGICNDYNLKFNLLDYDNNNNLPNIDVLEQFIKKNNGIIVLSLVTYKSSYRYPISKINRICQENDSIAIWDLSHAIGAIDIDMKINEIDYAIGCTYKYLNGGPGSPAFIYARNEKQVGLKSPIKGWFSHSDPFDFSMKYVQSESMNKFSSGTPHIISMSTLDSSLDITINATTKKIENKSIDLYNFFTEIFYDRLLNLGFKIITPKNKDERGSHISIVHKESWRITKCLTDPEYPGEKKIIVDFRPPNIIRIALTPLYVSFNDIFRVCIRLVQIIESNEYEKKDGSKDIVT
ncbi:MAG: kynureninase [Bacteroidetes bacterium]|nr:kynureninase [Bacteroidota bacterium]MDA1225720.1 kynureninase [Bacteroidota bacterium]